MTRDRAGPIIAAIALVAAACAAAPPSRTSLPSAEPVVPGGAEATDGAFRLELDLPRTIWRSAEPITGTAELDYSGVGERLLYGSGAGLIGFTWAQVGGTKHGGWTWQADCSHHPISAAAPLSTTVHLGAAFSADDPDASFYAAMDWQNPRLPPGDYVLGAVSTFTEVPCTGESAPPGSRDYDIATPTITIHVTP
jgi:hypothetical protein